MANRPPAKRAPSSRPKRKPGRHTNPPATEPLAPSERPASVPAGEVKSAEKSAPGIPFQPGDDPRRGRGPEKGAPNAGRPPNWLRDWCDDLLADQTAKQQVEEVLRDKSHSAFATMWKAIADRAHGKPAQSVTHEAGTSLEKILAKSWELERAGAGGTR